MSMTKIFLVDDHDIFRGGLQSMLETEEDFKVVGEAGCAQDALDQIESVSPEIILMDVKMPGTDGLQLTKQLVEKRQDYNIIMLTMFDEYRGPALEAGAKGYLLKNSKPKELIRAIRSVKERHPGRTSRHQQHTAI